MSGKFSLHERLQADTSLVADLALCSCLLMEDARFPWLILVPRIDGMREFHDVPQQHRAQLLDEIDRASRAMQTHGNAYKLNVAALGNQVEQLHIHVIARTQDDPAWPGPVWGVGKAMPYEDAARNLLLARIRADIDG